MSTSSSPGLAGRLLEELIAEAEQDAAQSGAASERLPDPGNAERLRAFFAEERATIGYVGKLSEEKGVHLLLEALRELDARAVIAGFGEAREALEAQAASLDVLFTGALEHRHLARLWPLCDVAVVPSTFPEAFGMVAAEAAASGVPPVVARHSGLATVAGALEEVYPPATTSFASFESGDAADLARVLGAVLSLPTGERARLGEAAREVAVGRWSWQGVAARLIEGVPLR